MPNAKNRTRFKSLDKIADDDRVEEIWEEGSDGIWVALKNGFQWEGVHCVHEWSVRVVIAAFRSVEPCTSECCAPVPVAS
jgi:hypothetical protein